MSETDAKLIVAGDAAVLARRYAGALYDLAGEHKKTDIIADDLRVLQSCLRQSAELRYIVLQPRLSLKQTSAAIEQLVAIAKLDNLTANFLGLIARNRRLKYLAAIIDAFMAELAAGRGEFTAAVTVARPLSDAQQAQLAARLRELAGGAVHIVVREDAGLLGGLVVRLGSRLIDASVKSKLARLERQMKTAPSGSLTDSQRGAA